jgi:ABC-type multidrug transport system ATPase subunit
MFSLENFSLNEGAGKTTLMNVLALKNNNDLKITGNVKLNGQFLQDPLQLSSISAYVNLFASFCFGHAGKFFISI